MFYGDIYPESLNGLQILPSNVWQMIVILLNARDYFVILLFDLSSARKIFSPHRTAYFIRPLKPLLSLLSPLLSHTLLSFHRRAETRAMKWTRI